MIILRNCYHHTCTAPTMNAAYLGKSNINLQHAPSEGYLKLYLWSVVNPWFVRWWLVRHHSCCTVDPSGNPMVHLIPFICTAALFIILQDANNIGSSQRWAVTLPASHPFWECSSSITNLCRAPFNIFKSVFIQRHASYTHFELKAKSSSFVILSVHTHIV